MCWYAEGGSHFPLSRALKAQTDSRQHYPSWPKKGGRPQVTPDLST
jgi:hypothetical protein